VKEARTTQEKRVSSHAETKQSNKQRNNLSYPIAVSPLTTLMT
jgi:hypothetical protein